MECSTLPATCPALRMVVFEVRSDLKTRAEHIPVVQRKKSRAPTGRGFHEISDSENKKSGCATAGFTGKLTFRIVSPIVAYEGMSNRKYGINVQRGRKRIVPGANRGNIILEIASDGACCRVVSHSDRSHAFLKEVLLGRRGELTGVIVHRAANRIFANTLERGNCHRGEEADDDNDDHNFDKGETLLGVSYFAHDIQILNVYVRKYSELE